MIQKIKAWIKEHGSDLIAWCPVLGLLMLLSAIPFGWSDYQRICLIILGVGYVSDYIVHGRWKQLAWNNSKWIYCVMLFLWVLPYIRHCFDPAVATDYFWYQMHIHEWFGYVGLIGLLGFSPKLRMQHVAWVMLLTSAVMTLYCLWLFGATDEYLATYGNGLERFDVLRLHHINSHMVMNLYINTAIILGLLTLEGTSKVWQKVLLILLVLMGLTLIFLSKGRIGQGTALLILGCYAIYKMSRYSKAWYLLVIPILAVGIWGALHINERFDVSLIRHDPRFAIWDYSIRAIAQEPINGYGYASLDGAYLEGQYTDSVAYNGFVAHLLQCYDFRIQGKTLCTHHPHNAFMLYWLAMGIYGLLGLILLFVCGGLLPMKKGRKFYLMLFLMALLIQCMTEPIGGHLLPQFFCIILFVWQRTSCAVSLSEDQL